MPRRGHVVHVQVHEDPLYNDILVTKLINKIMYDGERGTAQKICYGAFDIVKQKTGKDPLEVFQEAMKNIMPVLEVRPRRVGGATYQVPMEVRQERRLALGIRWLVDFARKRTERTMRERLAGEILDASNSLGGAVRKREETHKMAEANKAFAHYRW
jgi:small subunit ribosomal protein S7